MNDLIVGNDGLSTFQKNLPKYKDFISWMRWYPDEFLDLLKPPTGGINLHTDQRLMLRTLCRYYHVYGCFPRAYSKTLIEVLAMFIAAISHPNIALSLTAQTKDAALLLLESKVTEILRFYPLLENEIIRYNFSKAKAEIVFKNNAKINVLANHVNSKGQRRHRMNIEESVLLDNETYEDALEPIVGMPRYTSGPLSIVNPEELNKQINFLSTPGWKGSDEHQRNKDMIRKMINLEGSFVLGSDWMLASWYDRGNTKDEILATKNTSGSVFFDQNYGGKWTGSSSGALININKLISCRVLKEPLFGATKNEEEFYIGFDVARSENNDNNKSCAVVVKVNRNPSTNRIINVDVVHIMDLSNTLPFEKQAIFLKRLANDFNARMVIVDGNATGTGFVDELLRDHSNNSANNKFLGCWNTVNTNNKPESLYADKILFDFKASGNQTALLSTFMDVVNSGKLRLLIKKVDGTFTQTNLDNAEKDIAPFSRTDALVEEIGNLKLVQGETGALRIKQVVRKVNKDRFSALAMVLWYVTEYENTAKRAVEDTDYSKAINLSRASALYKGRHGRVKRR